MKYAVVGAVALMVVAASAQASEWNFYGSARVSTFYTDVDNPDSAKTFSQGLSAESVVGAEVTSSDTVTGRVEYGSEEGTANIRYLYGQWQFGPGALLVGKDDGPLAHPGSDQVYNDDAGLGGWGEMASQKKAQIKLVFKGFGLAFREPDAGYNDGASNVTANTEVTIPSVEAKYQFSGDNWNLAVNGGYFRYEVEGAQDVTSYVLGVGGDLALGAFVLGGNLFGGQNLGNLVDADVNGGETGKGYALYSGGQVVDNDALGWKVHLTYAINGMFSLHGGYGYMKTELENAAKDDVQVCYAQLPVTLAPGVTLVPELGVVDFRQDTDGSRTTYLGAKWQIDF